MIYDPITIGADGTVGEAKALMHENKIGGIPVIDDDRRLIGIVTNRDLRFQTDAAKRISEVMTKDNLVTTHNSDLGEAAEILLDNKIEKLPVVDAAGKLVGLLTYKDITLNKNDYSVTCAGREVELSKHEFALLELFMESPGRTCTKSRIYDNVWDYENSADDNTLNVHISKLRKKLKECNPAEDYIETVWGIGYRLRK